MKTTKKDLELFKTYVEKYMALLGLTEWSTHFIHEYLDNDSYAQTYWRHSTGLCTFQFSTSWDNLRPKTESEIERLALHEVLHVLIAPLTAEAESRYTDQNSIDTAEHLIVRRLEKLVGQDEQD